MIQCVLICFFLCLEVRRLICAETSFYLQLVRRTRVSKLGYNMSSGICLASFNNNIISSLMLLKYRPIFHACPIGSFFLMKWV